MDYVLRTRRMPPASYSAVHLGSRLTPTDVAILRQKYKEQGAEARAFAPIAAPAAPQTDLEKARIYLGYKLYHDGRLSTNNLVSCSSCHELTKGGTDNLSKSEGVPGPDGHPQLGGVNAPTTFNAAGNIRQFWDGRAADLKEQAGGPPLNPVEMGYACEADWDIIAHKLSNDPELVALFAYGLVLQIVNTVSRSVNRIAGEQVVREVKKQIMEKSKELDIASFDNPILYEKMEISSAGRTAAFGGYLFLCRCYAAGAANLCG
jgi:cytochrome c peroxidase